MSLLVLSSFVAAGLGIGFSLDCMSETACCAACMDWLDCMDCMDCMDWSLVFRLSEVPPSVSFFFTQPPVSLLYQLVRLHVVRVTASNADSVPVPRDLTSIPQDTPLSARIPVEHLSSSAPCPAVPGTPVTNTCIDYLCGINCLWELSGPMCCAMTLT